MPALVKSLRALSDPTRLRLLLLLIEEEVTVAELQEILGMGQSRISASLSLLKREGLTAARRVGKNIFYSSRPKWWRRSAPSSTPPAGNSPRPPATAPPSPSPCTSARTRRRSISTSWRANLAAPTSRVDRGRRSRMACSACCRPWSSPTSARGRHPFPTPRPLGPPGHRHRQLGEDGGIRRCAGTGQWL